MVHQNRTSGYEKLVERLNRFPQGAPPSQTLYKILQLLFDEHEARMVSLLPIKPFTRAKAAKAWKISEKEAGKLLDRLAPRAPLLKISRALFTVSVLPPSTGALF